MAGQNKFKNIYTKKDRPLDYLIPLCLGILALIFFAYIPFLKAQPKEVKGTTEEELSSCDNIHIKGIVVGNESIEFVLGYEEDRPFDDNLLRKSVGRLISYFFDGIHIPGQDFWVNLNPDEPERITSMKLTNSHIGKVLLEADLQLKKDACFFTNPETECGNKYWSRIDVQIPASVRLWIVPDEVYVYEEDNRFSIVKSRLRISLEGTKNSSQVAENRAVEAMRDIILPKLNHEVNYGKKYAQLREVLRALSIARWYRQKYWNRSGLRFSYIDNKIYCPDSKVNWDKRQYWEEYVNSLKKGEYSHIKTEYIPYISGFIQKRYFSGGVDFTNIKLTKLNYHKKGRSGYFEDFATLSDRKDELLICRVINDKLYLEKPPRLTKGERQAFFIKQLNKGEVFTVRIAMELVEKEYGLKGKFSYSTIYRDLKECDKRKIGIRNYYYDEDIYKNPTNRELLQKASRVNVGAAEIVREQLKRYQERQRAPPAIAQAQKAEEVATPFKSFISNWHRVFQKSKEKFTEKERAPPRIIAHMGLHDEETPPNTVRSFLKALEAGVDGIELDVRLTQDGKVVVFHDEDLSRVTNGNGSVEANSQDELAEIEFNHRNWNSHNDKIPTLDEALETISSFSKQSKRKTRVYIDVKTTYDESEKMLDVEQNQLLIRKIIEQIKRFRNLDITLCSFFPEALAKIREMDPDIRICYLLSFYNAAYLKKLREEILKDIRDIGVTAVHINREALKSPIVQDFIKRKLSILTNLTHIDADGYYELMNYDIEAVGVDEIKRAVRLRDSGMKMIKNIRLFPWLNLLMGLCFHSSFYIVFLQKVGYSLSSIGWAFALFSLTFGVASWPLGWIADRIGKRNILILCSLFIFSGFIFLSFSGTGSIFLVLAQLLSAFGLSGYVVASNSFLYESVNSIKQSRHYSYYLGKALSLFWISMAVSTITGSILASLISLQAVILLSASFSIMTTIFLLKFAPTKQMSKLAIGSQGGNNALLQIKKILGYTLKDKALGNLLLFDLLIGSAVTILLGFFMQPLLGLSGIALAYFGVIMFVFSLIQSLSAKIAHRFAGLVLSKAYRTGVFLGLAALVISFFAFDHCIPLIFLFFSGLFFWEGLSNVIIDAQIQNRLGDSFRAQWFAFKCIISGIVLMLMQGAINIVIDSTAIQYGVFATVLIAIISSILIKIKTATQSL